MNQIEIADRLSNGLARVDALALAIEGAAIPDEHANALIYLAGEVRDYLAVLRADLEATRKKAD